MADLLPVLTALAAGDDAGEHATFVAPAYGATGLDAVLPGVLGALGAPGGDASATARLGLPAATRACVVLVDGLGWENLRERAGHASFLRPRLSDPAAARPLTTTYPSTTAAAIGTFGTGAAPGRTAMLGYTVRDPASQRLVGLVSWDGAPDPRTWQRETPRLEVAASGGLPVTSVGPARFAGSGMTVAALRGGAYVPAERLGDRVSVAARALRSPGLVYLYWGDVDKVGHHEGWRSAAWGHAVEELDAELSLLARSLPAGTLLVVTADHGMVDVDPTRRWDVATDPVLRADVALVGGEPRASHLYLEPGADPRAVAARWSEHLGDAALVGVREDVVAAGLFGDVAPHALPVIGDVVVAATGRASVVDSRTQTAASLTLVGMHGSLTPAEMRIPLVVEHT
ncbi:alkaline phosphatase family protein [Luteimicrobium sp. NPDC057192]|uniref:alkaline phosphatase family protein n=1 Tax=Luteimicrobium sp. NPDC057192 TaxID=3346042 RepID=UPI00363091F4